MALVSEVFGVAVAVRDESRVGFFTLSKSDVNGARELMLIASSWELTSPRRVLAIGC